MITQDVEPILDIIRIPPEAPGPYAPVVLRLDPIVRLSDDQIEVLSSINEALRIERNAQGDLELQYLQPAVIAHLNAVIAASLGTWARQDGSGVGFGSSVGLTLPDGALRSPSASWILKSRLAGLTEDQRRGFPPISPDFAIELRSSSDRLTVLRRKMDEYMENGVRLAWLIDTIDCRAHIYRPGVQVEVLDRPDSLSGDPELPGFILNLIPVWEPGL